MSILCMNEVLIVDSFIAVFIQRKGDEHHNTDSDWVQCYSCRKWRMLNAGFNVDNLPEEWFV
jgi:hypothetical protein